MNEPDYPEDFPTKNKKRAERKTKFKAVKHHAYDVAKYIWKMPEKLIEGVVCRSADNLAKCNCWMCRNPRRVFKGKAKLTIQERKFIGK